MNIIIFVWLRITEVMNIIIFVWLRITDEGSVPEMRIWSILLLKSDLKWCIHLSISLYLYIISANEALGYIALSAPVSIQEKVIIILTITLNQKEKEH